jgi:apolipoprotein D and lipocalin family protein
MKTVIAALLLLLSPCLCPAQAVPPVQTVPSVDLARYAGLWHEIARYPNFFQEGCRDSTATYTLRSDNELEVVNHCTKGIKPSQAKGRAWLVDPADPAKLKVTFFWPFRSDYWIIDLGENYEYAVVGTPDRKYLWILARQPKLSPELYAGILQRVEQQGFDPARLR